MTPTSSVRAVLAVSVLGLAACSDIPSTPNVVSNDEAALAAVQASARLEATFQRISPEVMAIPGAAWADNDESIGKLVIGVERGNGHAVGAVRAAMARLGVSEADYAVEETQPIQFAATLRDVFRPVIAGVQIHFGRFVCSIGANVDKGTERSFITASHCTNTQGGVEGTTYAQPDRTTDPTVIATEVDDPVYVKGGAGCPNGKKCRNSDASRALYSASIASDRGTIAQTTGVNNGSLTLSTLTPTFTVASQDNTTKSFPIGFAVDKVGRTTGWTRGQVTRTCVNTGVSGSTVFLFCQTFVSDPGGATVVSGGDSGSGVFHVTAGNLVQLVGLLWGGSSDNKTFVFSPLASVQQELGALNGVH